MKVKIITRYTTPYYKEGVGIGGTTQGLLENLRSLGLNPSVISTQGEGLVNYFIYSVLGVLPKLGKADVFHAFTPMESLWIPKSRSVVTYHDLFQVTDPERIGGGMGYNPIKKLIGVKMFHLACLIGTSSKRVVCVSDKTKKEVIKYLKVPESKIRVIRWGINPLLTPMRKGLSPFLRIGYLGMLDKRKRVNLLIDAYSKRKLRKVKLFIAGKGLDEARLKAQAGTDSFFSGFVPKNKLSNFYNNLDLFIFPSALEGYGLPIVEAMACGLPVVVLKDSKIPEEVKGRCIVVGSLSEVLDDLGYTLTLIKGVDKESNLKFARTHNWKKCAEEYIKVYKEVLDEA